MGYFYKPNIAGTKYGLSWSIFKKNIGPQKFKKSGLVLPAFLKTGKVAGNALA